MFCNEKFNMTWWWDVKTSQKWNTHISPTKHVIRQAKTHRWCILLIRVLQYIEIPPVPMARATIVMVECFVYNLGQTGIFGLNSSCSTKIKLWCESNSPRCRWYITWRPRFLNRPVYIAWMRNNMNTADNKELLVEKIAHKQARQWWRGRK